MERWKLVAGSGNIYGERERERDFCRRGEKETWRAFAIGEVEEDRRRSETDSDWVFRLLY